MASNSDEDMEEYHSEWQKGVWDFAVITTESNDKIYVMNGRIDYKYALNYGILVEEHYNCCGGCSSYNTLHERNLIPFHLYKKEKTKRIDVDVQYYWNLKGESWHFENDFYPHLIHVYKYKNTQNAQTKPQNVSKPKEIYEMALLMDTNRKYRKILSGPVIYDTQHQYISFNETQPYIKGDIHVLRKYGFCAKKVPARNFFSIFNQNPQYGIAFNFDCLNKVELWQLYYDKKQKWDRYKEEQKEEKYDIVLVTNEQKVIQYMLYNVIINCIDELLKFTSFQTYESGDRQHLEQFAIKVKGFGIEEYKLWLDNENKTNFIVDTLYDTVRHTKFVFPDRMEPFKAFFYRFKSPQNRFEWKQYKHPTAHLSLENLMHFRMDSNLQLIYNTLSPKEQMQNKNIDHGPGNKMEHVQNEIVIAIDRTDEDSNEHVQNREVIAIDHECKSEEEYIQNEERIAIDDVYENKEDEYNEIKESSLIDDATTDTTSNAPNYDEMIGNYSIRKDYNGCAITPKKVKQYTQKKVYTNNDLCTTIIHAASTYDRNTAKRKSHDENNDEIWSVYLRKYGFEPKNATHLMQFSKYCPEVRILKYVEARKCFNKHKRNKVR